MTLPMPNNPPLVSIILPTYNEAGNIVGLIDALGRCIPYPHEIIVVDDNSPDGTWHMVEEIARNRSSVRIERRLQDPGLTKSIQHGIDRARGEIICWMDCDFSHPPETMAQLITHVLEGHDLAVASRYMKGGQYKSGLQWFGADESALAVLLSRFINTGIRWSLDPRFHDYTSGFIAARRHVLQRNRLSGDYGEYFMDLMYRAIRQGHRYKEIPFVSPPRRSGVSKTGTTFRQLFRRGTKYLRTLWRLWGLRWEASSPTGRGSR